MSDLSHADTPPPTSLDVPTHEECTHVYDDTEVSLPFEATLRLFLAIAAAMDLDLFQLDIDTAFLYAPIVEDVYIREPLGFSDGTNKVCHLQHFMYGLKQSPREFNMLFRDLLVNNGWHQCFSDPCI
jgi:hypothetical protein